MGTCFGREMGWDVEDEGECVSDASFKDIVRILVDGHLKAKESMRCHVRHVRTIPPRLAKSIERNIKSIVASVSSRRDVDDTRDFRVGGVHL